MDKHNTEGLNFIGKSCMDSSLREIKDQHIIPVFTKDNTALISQSTFIEMVGEQLDQRFSQVSEPIIKLSHPIKGRIPDARHKAKHELLPHEETLYYQRMIFIYRIKSVVETVNRNTVTLFVGGVKAYNHDNLNKDYRGYQRFKLFIGFQVKVCSNLCIWSDGAVVDVKINRLDALQYEIVNLINTHKPEADLLSLRALANYSISDRQFALLIGRCKMYQSMPNPRGILPYDLDITERQLSSISRGYLQDSVFHGSSEGIDLWSLYNLVTDSAKSSYADLFIDRCLGAGKLVIDVSKDLEGEHSSYFIR